jgi:hypothetical protein
MAEIRNLTTNPIEITLNNTTTSSDEYVVGQAIFGSIIFPVISGMFDGATVKIQQYVGASIGWQDVTWRTDASSVSTLIFSTAVCGDEIKFPSNAKFKFVCLNATTNTDIKISISY